MTATASTSTQLRMKWDSRYAQTNSADIVQKARRTNETVSEIEAWGVVTAPAGKSYRFAAYRTFDRAAVRGDRVKWDCAIYVPAGKGSRMLPESALPHVRAFILQMFRRAVEACAAADWDSGDAAWPACDPFAAAVADYAEAVRDLEAVAKIEGANISGETLAFNLENVRDHAATLEDSTGLFDLAATDSAIAWARIHAGEGRARAAGFRAGMAPRDLENPHMAGTGHAIAWAEGYEAGLAVFRNEAPAPVETVRRDNCEYHAGRKAFADGLPATDCPFTDYPNIADSRFARWQLGHAEAAKPAPLKLSGNAVRDNMARQREGMAAIAENEAGERGGPGLVRVIDATPTWAAVLPMLRAAVENGTPEGRRIAWEELARMAEAADRFNAAARDLRA